MSAVHNELLVINSIDRLPNAVDNFKNIFDAIFLYIGNTFPIPNFPEISENWENKTSTSIKIEIMITN